jgi:AraC-like DNA-binding protein
MGNDGGAWLVTTRGNKRVHRHEALEFNLVVRGTGRYLLGDRRYDLSPDSLVWLFPEQDHILVETTPGFRVWVVYLQPSLRRAFSPEMLTGMPGTLFSTNPVGHFCRQLSSPAAKRLHHLLSEVNQCDSDGDRPRFCAGLAFAAMTAWSLHETASQVPEGAQLHAAVERSAALLAADGDALLTDVAAESGISISHLRHLFRAQTGQSLGAFRNRQRIRRLIEAIDNGDRRPLLTLALEAGFGSYAQFHRVFKSSIGVGPRTWMARRT